MNIIFEKHINPDNETRKSIDNFLNSGFFDCPIDNFIGNETYYVAKINGVIVGARKVLSEFNKYFLNTKWKKRLLGLIDENRDAYYLQALAVDSHHRQKGIGSKLLEMAIMDIPCSSNIFVSLCSTNTIKGKYSKIYNFKKLRKMENRVILGRVY